jgi:syntaxin 1B/2/3
MTLVLIVVIIVVAVVAYIMVNRAANGGQNTGGKKRSLFQRSVLDDLQMNTARAAEISADVAPTLRPARRRLNSARDFRIPTNQEVEDATKKRFVVDWEGVDPTGSNA